MARLSARQRSALVALGRQAHSVLAVAQAIDSSVPTAQHVLDALYRRSLVTISTESGRYVATERGRKAVAA